MEIGTVRKKHLLQHPKKNTIIALKNHLLQHPKNPIATFENHLL